MKFLKPMLLTAFAFLSISATILFSACEKDSCTDLTCQNGGACSSGFCHCTTGYEGAQCETLSEARFLGSYIGITTCDTAAGILDTVSISTVNGSNTQVAVSKTTSPGETFYGSISITGGQYLIVVPSAQLNSNTTQKYTISWNARKLNFVTNLVTNGKITSTCNFIGNQQ